MELIEVPSEYRNVTDTLGIEVYRAAERILSKRFLDTCEQDLENHRVVLELDLCLGRMDIHIDRLRIDLHIYEI